MANIQERRDKSGKLISYSIRVNGKLLKQNSGLRWETPIRIAALCFVRKAVCPCTRTQ